MHGLIFETSAWLLAESTRLNNEHLQWTGSETPNDSLQLQLEVNCTNLYRPIGIFHPPVTLMTEAAHLLSVMHTLTVRRHLVQWTKATPSDQWIPRKQSYMSQCSHCHVRKTSKQWWLCSCDATRLLDPSRQRPIVWRVHQTSRHSCLGIICVHITPKQQACLSSETQINPRCGHYKLSNITTSKLQNCMERSQVNISTPHGSINHLQLEEGRRGLYHLWVISAFQQWKQQTIFPLFQIADTHDENGPK